MGPKISSVIPRVTAIRDVIFNKKKGLKTEGAEEKTYFLVFLK
jgi:hypothetical protein